jgi:hypothetical protein
MVNTNESIGLCTYEHLPVAFQRLYLLKFEEAKRQPLSQLAWQMFVLFKKFFDTHDLLAMENHGLIYQTFVSPPNVTDLASKDLAQFYYKRSWDDNKSHYYAAKYIDARDIAQLKKIQASTVKKLKETWDLMSAV